MLLLHGHRTIMRDLNVSACGRLGILLGLIQNLHRCNAARGKTVRLHRVNVASYRTRGGIRGASRLAISPSRGTARAPSRVAPSAAHTPLAPMPRSSLGRSCHGCRCTARIRRLIADSARHAHRRMRLPRAWPSRLCHSRRLSCGGVRTWTVKPKYKRISPRRTNATSHKPN